MSAYWRSHASRANDAVRVSPSPDFSERCDAASKQAAPDRLGAMLDARQHRSRNGSARPSSALSASGPALQHASSLPVVHAATSVVTELAAEFNGEVPELAVVRPTLEDIYLRLIGQAEADAAEAAQLTAVDTEASHPTNGPAEGTQ